MGEIKKIQRLHTNTQSVEKEDLMDKINETIDTLNHLTETIEKLKGVLKVIEKKVLKN